MNPFRAARRSLLATRVLLLVLSIAFRGPVLANAWGLNSDVAIVGLQGRHIFHDWSPFLWGSGYQSSTESLVAGALFAVFGSGPTVLLASALALQIVLTFAVFEGARILLKNRYRRPKYAHETGLAFVVALLFVFTPPSVHSYALNPPRQASITLAGIAWLLALLAARSPAPKNQAWLRGGAVALAGFASYADPYALLFTPAIFATALLPLIFPRFFGVRRVGLQPAALIFGALLGQIPPWLLRHASGAQNGTLGFDTTRIAHNAEILRKTCLPWALALEAWAPKYVMNWEPWTAPAALTPLRWLGALVFVALAASAVPLAFVRKIPAVVRLAGLIGAVTMVANLTSFLGSVMIFDHFAMRYLAALVIAAPFAFLPAAYLLGARRFFAVLAPWLLSSAICAWVAYLPFGVTRSAIGRGDDEKALQHDLQTRKIVAATADYWACYRLDFLWEETIAVVPTHAREDRYAPYRKTFQGAPVIAYVHDAGRSRESLDDAKTAATEIGTITETFHEGIFTVFVVVRRERSPSQKP